MALVVADRVKETTTTTGTGAYSLAGAEDSFQAFGSVLSNSDTTYYAITDGTYWEVGIGTYTSSTDTLARTTILESSNSDNAVNWTAGEKQIFATMPADKVVYKDANGNIAVSGTVDGVDIATRDATLTSTTTTANAAMPKAGGTFTGSITMEDGDQINVGTSNDLVLSHNNSNAGSLVSYTGEMTVKSNSGIMNVSGSSVKLQRLGSTILEAYSGTVDVTGNIVVSGTVDGVDIATRDGVLTSTTTTANAALPKAGGTMTGAIRLDQDNKTGSGGTLTLDLAAANNFKISMTANTTIAFSNKNPGLGGNLIFVQDATGGNSFTLPSECKTPVNGASIVQSTGANEISILSYYVLSSTQILVNYIGDFA